MHDSTALRVALIVIGCILMIYLLTPEQRFSESFLIDMPNSAQLETIDMNILSHFTVFSNKAFDVAKLTDFAQTSDDSGVGKSAMYQVVGQNIKTVVEDVFATRLDYTRMKRAYQSFVMAISYDNSSNDITYFVLEYPWKADANIFADPAYQIASETTTLYVPAWKYTESDPSPFFIPDDCMKLIKQWETTSDSNILKQLETNPCISKQNKIRFVGLILVNYLNMLEQNSYNFKGACRQYQALANNIQNPELRAIFSKINEVCANTTGVDDDTLEDCVKPFNDWVMSDKSPGVPNDNECFTVANKKAFLARLKKFMKIGQYIPAEYVDSFYLMVDQLYNDSQNKNMKSFLKNFQRTNANIDKWKQSLDNLMTGIVSGVTVTLNGNLITDASIDSVSARASPKSSSGDCIHCTFAHSTKLDCMMIAGAEGQWISKLTMRYADPYRQKVWIDFSRVLFANDDATTVAYISLDGIITTDLKLTPIESTGIGFRIDFLGFPVEIRKCDQTISVCEHEKQMKANQQPLALIQQQYQQLQQQHASSMQLNSALQAQTNNLTCKPIPRCLPCLQK